VIATHSFSPRHTVARSMQFWLTASLISCAVAAPPTLGNYETNFKSYTIPKVAGDGGSIHVYHPSNATAGEQFPLISYAHGLAGGSIDLLGYAKLFSQMASFGFIVVAPNTCNLGCADKVKSPYADCNEVAVKGKNPDAAGWNTWFGEQIKAIEWAQNQAKTSDPIFKMLDSAAGVAIAGHSMGGQATAWAAHQNCTSRWNIKAAAIHHGVYGTTNDKIGVPVAAFGSTGDASISMKTKDVYTKSPVLPKMWRYIVGSSHLEPVLVPPAENPLLATYTVAWFKVIMNLDHDNYWHDMIYDESSPNYVCKSQKMQECEIDKKKLVVV